MENKPIIRHCRNCKYAALKPLDVICCCVRYEYYERGEQRKTAIFCRHYKRMPPTPEFLNKRVNLPTKHNSIEEDHE